MHVQVKAYLRGESLPFSAGQLEGIASSVNMHSRVAKRLFGSSLRYWMLEYLRRQPKERRYRALILRFIKDRVAALLLVAVRFYFLSVIASYSNLSYTLCQVVQNCAIFLSDWTVKSICHGNTLAIAGSEIH